MGDVPHVPVTDTTRPRTKACPLPKEQEGGGERRSGGGDCKGDAHGVLNVASARLRQHLSTVSRESAQEGPPGNPNAGWDDPGWRHSDSEDLGWDSLP